MSQHTFPLPSHAALDALLQPQDSAFHPIEGLRRLREAGLDQLPPARPRRHPAALANARSHCRHRSLPAQAV
ncbi:hypothetical protein KIV45_12430 [Janthinobacterium lividum]|nr:hypothetical protein KIV45_12430 [Janthinobacterium lividum]